MINCFIPYTNDAITSLNVGLSEISASNSTGYLFKVSSKESHLDHLQDDLEEQKKKLEAETEAYTRRCKLYEEKELWLDDEFEKKHKDLESEINKQKQELEKEKANLKKSKDTFDSELKVGL